MTDQYKGRQELDDMRYSSASEIPVEQKLYILDLWKAMLENKILIIVSVLTTTSIAIVIAFSITPIYRAEALLVPAANESGNRVGVMSGQLGGLASLTGIDIGDRGGSTDEAIAIMRSRDFTNNFIVEENILPILFKDKWDANNNSWKNKKDLPSLWDAYKIFNPVRKVHKDKKTGLVTVAIEWTDPKQAADWVSKIIYRINNQFRQQAIIDAEKSIQYLQSELLKTSVIEVKQSIYKMVEAQTKNKMLANTQQEYAFRVIDKAVVPEERIKPRRRNITIIGFVLGVLVAGFIIAYRCFKPADK